MKIRFIILLGVLFSGNIFSQNKIEIGKRAPEIAMSTLMAIRS
jgi:hypothetical protein